MVLSYPYDTGIKENIDDPVIDIVQVRDKLRPLLVFGR